MDSNMKKPGEIAKLLKVSGMSVRNYVKHFKPFLSETATANTGRKFTPEDVETLQHAKQLLDEGNTYNQVCEVLEKRPLTGEVIDQTPPEPEPKTEDVQPEDTALVPVEFYNQFLEQLQEQHKTALDAKDEYISELKQDKTRLQEEVERERHQKRQYYENLPRLVKRFTKPPE